MMRVVALLAALALAGPVAAQPMEVAGHAVAVGPGTDGAQALTVDGKVMLEDWIIFLDPDPHAVSGGLAVTGVAGAGGNACEAAPFVLGFPAEGEPALDGPPPTCAYLEMQAGPSALVFTGIATPQTPGEVWIWSPEDGFVAGTPVPFAADPALGWERLGEFDGAHPVDVLRLGQVEAQLQAGLGAGWPALAERISGLGSGALTAEGWLGEACLKLTCDDDWAVLYLHARSRTAFAFWAEGGQVRLFPPDPGLWPEEATAALHARTGG